MRMKKHSVALIAATTAALCLAAVQGMAQPPKPTPKFDKRARVGREINLVELDLEGKKAGRVYLGSYLVNAVGGCNDCHTAPSYVGGNPAEGDPGQVNKDHYLAGGGVFGPFVSPNLTPDENGLPAGLTRDEFVEMLRTGRKGGRYLAVMPWPVYRHMTDGDLGAIYEYLTAIPHAEPAAPN